MDRSIEGDASIRVGFDQQPIADAFHVFSFECLAKHSQGLQRIQSQRRGHELKAIVQSFLCDLCHTLYTCGYRITSFY